MTVFSHEAFVDHEQVVFVSDEAAGLKALIAIHDTTLGPALGGCRMYPYADEEAALHDVLRLSRGMTYKAAASGPEGAGVSASGGESDGSGGAASPPPPPQADSSTEPASATATSRCRAKHLRKNCM